MRGFFVCALPLGKSGPYAIIKPLPQGRISTLPRRLTMPKIALIRHGAALKPPYDGLTARSCLKIVALIDALSDHIGQGPMILCGEDPDSKATATTIDELLRGEMHVNAALSEKSAQKAEDLLARWMANSQKTIVAVCHRKSVRKIYLALERATGKRMERMPSFPRKIFEIRPQAILLDTSDVKTRIVRVKTRKTRDHMSALTKRTALSERR
jgi:hypothetical protein